VGEGKNRPQFSKGIPEETGKFFEIFLSFELMSSLFIGFRILSAFLSSLQLKNY
jgi:hypothetical protein